MRSWRERGGRRAGARGALTAGVLALAAACSEPAGSAACADSALTYETFGAAFVASWCRGCHSSELPPEMRQLAPLDVNFNSLADVRRFARRIGALAADSQSMPPAGGPSAEERALLAEWIDCGAR